MMMSLKNKLYNIKEELENIPTRSKTFEKCIRKRLESSIDAHSQYMKRICDYLRVRDSAKVLRTIKEFNKKKGKKASNGKVS